MDELTQRAREIVAGHGFDERIAEMFTLEEIEGFDGRPRGNVEVGFQAERKGRSVRVQVASINAPSVSDALATLQDRNSVADLVIAARPAMSQELRDIPLPEWAADRGSRIRDGIRRASRLANAEAKQAASGETADAPF